MPFLSRVWKPPARMFLVAFVVRLALILLAGTYHLNPAREHWRFGWEIGRVARSIALGQGFSSPFQGQTGPTAHFVPLYPYLLAGVFKLFGVYSDASALAIMSLNSLFSALTCVIVFYIAEKAFSRGVANVAAWIWAFHPLALYVSAKVVWDTTLSVPIVSCLLLAALRVQQSKRARAVAWAAFGLLWGVAAMNNPSVIAVLPPLFVWLWHRQVQNDAAWEPGSARVLESASRNADAGLPSLTGSNVHSDRSRAIMRATYLAGILVLIFVLCLAPWTLRNYAVFHRFIPLRSNFWLEMHIGNNALATGTPTLVLHPSHNEKELAEYRRLGETAYLAEKKGEALYYMKQNPGRFLWLTLTRIALWWSGGFELCGPNRLGIWLCGLTLFGVTMQSFLGFLGLTLMFRQCKVEAPAFAFFLLFYPLTYYFIFAHRRYSHTLDPITLMLGVFAVQQAFASRKARQPVSAPQQYVADG